jgi:predicted permease
MNAAPPPVLRRLLTWFLPSGPVRDGLLGDLDELYAERVRRGGGSPDLWYGRQLLSAAVHYTPRRLWARQPDGKGVGVMDGLVRDLGYAFRMLRRRPGFTAVIVLTLALGIGANTAIFSVVDAVLLQPLPYAEPDRLVEVIHRHHGDDDVRLGSFSREDFADLRQDAAVYESVAGYSVGTRVLTGVGEPQELEAAYVSSDFFRALGIGAALGRPLGSDEMVPGADGAVVLSHGFWRSRFGSDTGVLGVTVTLDGEPFTIVGVMPPSFDFPTLETSLWLPISLLGCDNVPCGRASRWLTVVARLAPDATLATASSATDIVLERLERAYPETNEGWRTATVIPLQESIVGDVRPALLVLLGAVALVLLIACANVANLLLARGATRGREFALRAALGAGRSRVVRQLLTESVALALVGGALGFLLAFGVVDAVVTLSAGSIPRSYEIRPDVRVAGFALAASVMTGVVFGLLPSITASRIGIQDSLNASGRSGGEGGRRQGRRRLLVVLETALAVVLLTGAGLLIRTFWNLSRTDTGFRAENVLSLSLDMSADVMGGDGRNAYRREIIQRIENLPGVLAVGGSKDVPLHGVSEWYSFSLPGRPDVPAFAPETHIVTGDYFRALGIPLLEGRVFTDADEVDERPLLIVNQTLARRYWPDRDPVGEALMLFGEREVRIAGVVGDVRYSAIVEAPRPAVYVLPHFGGRRSMTLFVRTASDPLPMANAFRQAIWEVNPDQPISVTTMRQVVSTTVAEPRFLTVLLGSFACLAVVLAALGVYGVTAYDVSRRTYEVGVRMALGARAGNVLRLIIAQGIAPVLGGLAIGLIAARALTRVLSSLLYGVEATDPLTFASVALLLGAVALLAVYVPARRAARVDPILALRAQ